MENNLIGLADKYDIEINKSCKKSRFDVINCFLNNPNNSWECQNQLYGFMKCIESFNKSFHNKYLKAPTK